MRRLAALSLVLLASLGGPSADVQATAQPPSCPYSAGLLSGAFVTGEGVRASMAVWVPTDAPEALTGRNGIAFYAAADAPPARDGRFGVALISHGLGGTAVDTHGLAAGLARCGWVVAAPLHPGTNAWDLSAEGIARGWAARPRHLALALDALLADPRLEGRLDLGRVAAVGFGMGGVAALQAAGAAVRPGRLASHCEAVPDDGICTPAMREAAAAAPIPREIDRRIRAVVALAPVGPPFAEGDLDAVRVPVLLYVAGADGLLPAAHHAERVATLLSGRAVVRSADGAGHFAFLSSVPEALAEATGPRGADAPGFDRETFQDRLGAVVAAFLAEALPAQEGDANSSRR